MINAISENFRTGKIILDQGSIDFVTHFGGNNFFPMALRGRLLIQDHLVGCNVRLHL
jgi:hypothetical protein